METRFDLFRQNGYVTIPSLVTPEQRGLLLEGIENLIERDFEGLPDWYPDTVVRDKLNRVTMLTMLHQYLPFCGDLLVSPSIGKIAADLLGTDVVPRSAIYLNKTPGSDAVPRHQDGHYFKISPCEAVTIWLALDDTDEENGCLCYEPGSHLNELLPHKTFPHPWIANRTIEVPESLNALPVSLRAGDAVIHHALTLHYSDRNRSSTRSRRSIAFVFFAEAS